MKIYNLNAFRMLSQGRESNPRSSQVLYAGCSSLPVFPCVYAAVGVIHHLRAMPTALFIAISCINKSKILEIARSPPVFIRLSLTASGLLLLWGSEESNLAHASVTCPLLQFTDLYSPWLKR